MALLQRSEGGDDGDIEARGPASCESDGRAMSRLVPSPSELEAHETPLRRPTPNWLFISKPPIMKSKPSPATPHAAIDRVRSDLHVRRSTTGDGGLAIRHRLVYILQVEGVG